jgi:hypothetical protein
VQCGSRRIGDCTRITGKPLPSNAAEDSFNLLPVFLGRQLSKPIRNAIGDQAVDGMLTIREGSWKRGCGLEGSVFLGMSRLHPVARRPNCITSQPILRSYTIYRITAGPGRHVNK